MKRLFLLAVISMGVHLMSCTSQSSLVASARADETITVTATSADISENLNLKTVATLFGQAENLEEFEAMINNPDSAFSNLDLNGDGQVDYLRVIETAQDDQHLVVIQAVLAKDIYQDVASIFVQKDPETQSVTVQVIGDEYIYGTNYVIEPVYLYRPVIYDWFWGASWVAWHSPYYWDYWPGWWRPYHCIDPYLYWDHCYWHHYHHPICSYHMPPRPHHHYADLHHHHLHRHDWATRHPERSFATRNASRNITNARGIEQTRRASVQQSATRSEGSTRVAPTASRSGEMNRTYGSSNTRSAASSTRTVGSSSRSAGATATRSASTTATATRSASTTSTRVNATSPSRTSSATRATTTNTATSRAAAASTATRTQPASATSTVRSTSTSTPVRASSSSSSVRSSSTSATRSSSSAVRSTSSSSSRSSSYSGGSYSGSSSRSAGSYSGGSSSRSGYSGGSRTR